MYIVWIKIYVYSLDQRESLLYPVASLVHTVQASQPLRTCGTKWSDTILQVSCIDFATWSRCAVENLRSTARKLFVIIIISIFNEEKELIALSKCLKELTALSKCQKELTALSKCQKELRALSKCQKELRALSKCQKELRALSKCQKELRALSKCRSSGAAWKLGWPSWAPHPCGRIKQHWTGTRWMWQV